MNEEVLEILSRLEQFRVDMNSGRIQAGSNDWIVRMCQAKVAQNHFDNRIEWERRLNKKEN